MNLMGIQRMYWHGDEETIKHACNRKVVQLENMI